MALSDRLSRAWNAFRKYDQKKYMDVGPSSSYRPDKRYSVNFNGRTIISSIYTRISIDVASLNFIHARVDSENGMYSETIDSALNKCMNMEANIDQSYFDFWLDVVGSLLDEGCIAVVPVDTSLDPDSTGSYDILTMRVGKIVEWSPENVKVRLFNSDKALYEDIWVNKRTTAIITNPFYSVMNETNSTLQRLVDKLALLDYVDGQSGSGKLDLIIQLPYVIKPGMREDKAEARRKSIEMQLSNSKYGVAYIDSTERVTQLNRPVENNLAASIEDLTRTLYNQLGMTESIFDGTASDQVLLNYYNQTICPIATAIVSEMTRKFLTKTARTQGQTVMFLRDPFKIVPISQLAEIADKFTRNEVLSSNEVRRIIGFKPSDDPKADELRNKNLSESSVEIEAEEQASSGGQESDVMKSKVSSSAHPQNFGEFVESM